MSRHLEAGVAELAEMVQDLAEVVRLLLATYNVGKLDDSAHDIAGDAEEIAARAEKLLAEAVFSREDCPFHYCDTKAPHDECAQRCRHAVRT
jgi:t-SNARE complex subunit (syntaxin)